MALSIISVTRLSPPFSPAPDTGVDQSGALTSPLRNVIYLEANNQRFELEMRPGRFELEAKPDNV